MYQIRKKFKFEMAHILDESYSKECQNIHGHSYVLEVFIATEYLNTDGMVIDFKQLKEIVQKEIINKLDHKIMVNKKGTWANDFQGLSSQVYWVDFNPTAENMVKDIFYELQRYPIFSMNEMKVRLHETDTGYAEYWEEDKCK